MLVPVGLHNSVPFPRLIDRTDPRLIVPDPLLTMQASVSNPGSRLIFWSSVVRAYFGYPSTTPSWAGAELLGSCNVYPGFG